MLTTHLYLQSRLCGGIFPRPLQALMLCVRRRASSTSYGLPDRIISVFSLHKICGPVGAQQASTCVIHHVHVTGCLLQKYERRTQFLGSVPGDW
jgi:hypothetical protein